MSATTSKLYQYQVCPFCWKARALLALKKVPYEAVEVHPLNKKELLFSDYKKVPVFVDDTGKQVNDSNAIMSHIDAHYSGEKIFETDSAKAAKEAALIAWSESYVKGIPPLIYNTFPNAIKAFDYITQQAKFSWYQKSLIKYSGAAVMRLVAAKSKEKQNIADPSIHFNTKLNEWIEQLDGQFFAGGNKPNAADAAVFGITLSVSGLPAAKLVTENLKFYEWVRRMSELTQLQFSAPQNA